MINFYENEDFNRTVFTIDYAAQTIQQHSLLELCSQYADVTTTPHGVGARYHTRDNELWTWGHNGNFPKLIEKFDNNEQAEHALLLSFKYDLFNGSDNPIVYDSENEAQEDLDTWLTELDDEHGPEL